MMAQENKELLVDDLCARLPHGVKVWRQGGHYVVSEIDIEKQRVYLKVDFEATRGWWFEIEEVKPYLRPMSSMTEDEQDEYLDLIIPVDGGKGVIEEEKFTKVLKFYNSHHLDYNGLIPMGLALPAKEEMYKDEKEKYKDL